MSCANGRLRPAETGQNARETLVNNLKTALLVVALALATTACFGDTSASGDSDTAIEETAIEETAIEDTAVSDTDRPCEGGAFPDDDEFRELLCAVQWAEVDVAMASAEVDPSWIARRSEAILRYADDRAASVAELEAVLAEMTAAAA